MLVYSLQFILKDPFTIEDYQTPKLLCDQWIEGKLAPS